MLISGHTELAFTPGCITNFNTNFLFKNKYCFWKKINNKIMIFMEKSG
jgi:hypothetical protein